MCGGCDLLILLDFVIFVIKYHILTVNSFKVLFKQSLVILLSALLALL